MIQLSNISKSYGGQTLFQRASFNLGSGERLGVVGRNGHGKSTLFRLILGQEDLDEGFINIPRDYRIGYLSQHLKFRADNVLDEACELLPEQEGGWKETYKAEAILDGLGFSEDDRAINPAALSGGFQVRLNLAKLLVSEPQLLLLDEPTNYLDIVSVRWLSRFLNEWPTELMIITHDRSFMDSVSTHTLAIHRAQMKKVKGSTADLYEQISQEEEIYEKTRLNEEKKREQTEQYIRRFRAKASKASSVQSKVKALEKMEKKEALQDIVDLEFEFNSVRFPGKFILHVKDLSFGFQEPLMEHVSFSLGAKDRIGVIGKNGRGKTTLLNLLAGELSPDTGKVEYSENAELAYFGQTNVDRLPAKKTIEDVIWDSNPTAPRAAVRGICGAMMFPGDLALKKVSVLSGGERSRVQLGQVLAKPANTLFLDEPTNHLDIQSSESLLEALEAFPGAIVFVTHDEGFLRALANKLIIFDRGKVETFEGGYDDFLRRIGWEGEGEETPSKTLDASKLSKKELRKLRAEQKERERAVIKPLENRVSAIEKEIVELEERVEKEQEELIEMTKDGYGDDAAKLSRSLHQNREKIEELFSEMEQVSADLEAKKSEIEKERQEI